MDILIKFKELCLRLNSEIWIIMRIIIRFCRLVILEDILGEKYKVFYYILGEWNFKKKKCDFDLKIYFKEMIFKCCNKLIFMLFMVFIVVFVVKYLNYLFKDIVYLFFKDLFIF